MIHKLASGKYRLYSLKKNPKTGKRRNLGRFLPGPQPRSTKGKWSSSNGAELRVQPNMRLKLSARGRHVGWNAQWKPSILSVAPAGRSLSATR